MPKSHFVILVVMFVVFIIVLLLQLLILVMMGIMLIMVLLLKPWNMLCFCLGHDPCLDVFHVHLSSLVIIANPIHDVFHVHHGPLVVFMKYGPSYLGSSILDSMFVMFILVLFDALLSHRVKPAWGFHKVKLWKSDLTARSRLPTLERGRWSSWEPRD